MLGIIGGTALLYANLPPLEKKVVATPFGPVEAFVGEIVFLPRHQFNVPPHRLNHKAHIAALKLLGVDKLILIGSVGSMKESLEPGSMVIVSDWFSPWRIETFHDYDIFHISTSPDADLSRKIHEILPETVFGTYLHALGPRFETRAEIAEFAARTDVVGMTMASELTLAAELEIPAAALCSVDNYANGICNHKTSIEELHSAAKQNSYKMTELISKIVEELK